jgi:hypothetical protein
MQVEIQGNDLGGVVKMYLPFYRPFYLGKPFSTFYLPLPSRAARPLSVVSQSVSRPFLPTFQPRRMAEGKRWRVSVRGSTCRQAS